MKHLPILKIGSYGLHVIKNPAGNYSFFGAIPYDLGEVKRDMYGNERIKTPSFATELEAIQYAKDKMPGHEFQLNKDGLHITE